MNHQSQNPSAPFAVVVNDDLTQLKVLSGLVRRAGLEPRAFTGAEAALAEMSALEGMVDRSTGASLALVVTDLYMPGIDGWRFCRLLRSPEYAAFNKVPILVVSATFAGDETSRIAADLGAEAFLPAPVDGRRFVYQVEAIMKGEQLRTPLRVLIVEKSKAQSYIIRKAFNAHGYQVDTALTLQAATDAFKITPFDVAVLDYHLPDGTGDTLLDTFCTERPDCVCLMMTTNPLPELALAWMRRGAAAYLQKPFEPAYLIELCTKARRERALLRAQDLLEVRTRELRDSEEKFRMLVENSHDIIYTLTADGVFLFVSPSWTSLLGHPVNEIIGKLFQSFVNPDDLPGCMLWLKKVIETGQRQAGIEYRVRHINGSWYWHTSSIVPLRDESGTITGFEGTARDITAQKQAEELLKESEQRYRELSIVDDLTQLYNSRHFYLQLKIELDRSSRYDQPLTLLVLDLDDFKAFNDTCGHVEGDQVLMRFGQVVKRCLRQSDSAYRYGGEEFTIILPMTTSADGAVTAERIRTEFKKETFCPALGQDVHVTVSIGLAQYKAQEEMKTFIHRVDQLMYQGKKNGKDRVCYRS